MSESGDPKSNGNNDNEVEMNIVEIDISDNDNLFLLTKYFNIWRYSINPNKNNQDVPILNENKLESEVVSEDIIEDYPESDQLIEDESETNTHDTLEEPKNTIETSVRKLSLFDTLSPENTESHLDISSNLDKHEPVLDSDSQIVNNSESSDHEQVYENSEGEFNPEETDTSENDEEVNIYVNINPDDG